MNSERFQQFQSSIIYSKTLLDKLVELLENNNPLHKQYSRRYEQVEERARLIATNIELLEDVLKNWCETCDIHYVDCHCPFYMTCNCKTKLERYSCNC